MQDRVAGIIEREEAGVRVLRASLRRSEHSGGATNLFVVVAAPGVSGIRSDPILTCPDLAGIERLRIRHR